MERDAGAKVGGPLNGVEHTTEDVRGGTPYYQAFYLSNRYIRQSPVVSPPSTPSLPFPYTKTKPHAFTPSTKNATIFFADTF